MIRHRLLCLLPFLALSLSGCSHRVPTATVVLVDPSGSVTPQARKEEFAAVGALIPKLQRGDLLIVIPITNDEGADIQGRVLRLAAPVQRQAYDADLRRFREEAEREYAAFAANLLTHPGERTDILGALDVARQELEEIPAPYRRRLIVLSDFLEDDGRYRFTSDPRLVRAATARLLAERLKQQHGFALTGVHLYPGALASGDFTQLGADRQQAVRAFWGEYFALAGKRVELQMDGTGMLATLGAR